MKVLASLFLNTRAHVTVYQDDNNNLFLGDVGRWGFDDE